MVTVPTKPHAVAFVKGRESVPHLEGEVMFYRKDNGCIVTAHIKGLPENETGFFAFHIHEGGSCEGENFPDTGSHYNPQNLQHPVHAGDLPPLLSCNGVAYISVYTNRFTIDEIIEKTVVIHDNADDFITQPSGNAGTKIACGVIEKIG